MLQIEPIAGVGNSHASIAREPVSFSVCFRFIDLFTITLHTPACIFFVASVLFQLVSLVIICFMFISIVICVVSNLS